MNEIIKKQDNLRSDYQVVKGNILNEGTLCNNTTLVEYRMLLISLSKISPVTKSLTVHFKAEDFCKLLGLVKNGMYSYIKNASQNLASRTITIEDKKSKKGETYPWLSKVKYDEAFVTIGFNPELRDHIINIQKEYGYTKYFIENILKLKSIYAVRLYELLKQYQKIGKRDINLEDLRKKIGAIQKSHLKTNFFRNRILIPSQNEINVCTDILFDFKEIKEGRKTKNIIFYIQSKIDFSKEHKSVRKDKLILGIQREIYNKTGHIFNAHHMNNLHRFYLLELLKNLVNGNFDKILIRRPENFFTAQLIEMQNTYDIDLISKRYDDF